MVWVTYENWDANGVMFCVAISDAGVITGQRITDWNYTTLNEDRWPIKVGPQTYAFAAHWTDSDGFVHSVTIADNGNITQSWIEYLEFDITNCNDVQLLSLGGIYYGVLERGVSSYWKVKTFSITAAGVISDANIDALNSEIVVRVHPRWCWVLGDIYIVVYEDTADDIIMSSVDIESYVANAVSPHTMLMGLGP